jgi:very-short-patch-repair endonuclease
VIQRRLEAGRLHLLHSGVYLLGHRRTNRRGYWLAAVLACGRGALLSHDSAAALWGLIGVRGGAIHVTSSHGRAGRPGIALHKGRFHAEDRAEHDGILVTSVARTILDLAAAHDEDWVRGIFEEADRLRVLHLAELRRACERGVGRRGVGVARRLAEEAIAAENDPASFLEDVFFTFCRKQRLPRPLTNVHLLGCEVDALWEEARLIVELDGWGSHRHRAAFERDRIRDADHAVAGYKVIRVTYRRLKAEPQLVAAQLRALLREAGRAPTQRPNR